MHGEYREDQACPRRGQDADVMVLGYENAPVGGGFDQQRPTAKVARALADVDSFATGIPQARTAGRRRSL
jgi:hypothetical protein